MTTRRTPVRLLLLVAVTATALTGCSFDRVGSAAVVGGEAISVETLQDVTDEQLAAGPGQDRVQVQSALLTGMILDRAFDGLAERVEVSVSKGQVSNYLREVVAQLGGREQLIAELSAGGQVVPPSRLDEWARQQLLTDRIIAKVGEDVDDPSQASEEAGRMFNREVKKLAIEVNPRYGRWNPQAGITPLTSGGLATDVGAVEDDS